MAAATIFHNPRCTTSLKVLERLRASGLDIEVVDYLRTGWTAAQLQVLFAQMGVGPRDVLRLRGASPEASAMAEAAGDDAALIAAMIAHPVLVERPIVRTAKGAALCRPVDRVDALI